MQHCSLMLDVEGIVLTDSERARLQSDLVGGLILFARNYQSRQQLRALVADIRAQNPDIVIAVDQEGGRVQRFRDEFVTLPPMYSLHQAYQLDPQLATEQARELGWLMAYEITSLDIDISFAPVLDLYWGQSKVIGERSFGANYQQVIELTQCFVEGMRQAGMKATGKHFPGHGWATADSHLQTAIDERAYEAILKDDLKPFVSLINSGLNAIMPAHVIYPQVDSKPAGFSSHWLQTILRKELKFDGVIFSDDLNMNGAQVASPTNLGQYASRAKAAMDAGCDTVLVCNNASGATEVLEFLTSQGVSKSRRLPQMKKRSVAPDNARFDRAKQIASELHSIYQPVE